MAALDYFEVNSICHVVGSAAYRHCYLERRHLATSVREKKIRPDFFVNTNRYALFLQVFQTFISVQTSFLIHVDLTTDHYQLLPIQCSECQGLRRQE